MPHRPAGSRCHRLRPRPGRLYRRAPRRERHPGTGLWRRPAGRSGFGPAGAGAAALDERRQPRACWCARCAHGRGVLGAASAPPTALPVRRRGEWRGPGRSSAAGPEAGWSGGVAAGAGSRVCAPTRHSRLGARLAPLAHELLPRAAEIARLAAHDGPAAAVAADGPAGVPARRCPAPRPGVRGHRAKRPRCHGSVTHAR